MAEPAPRPRSPLFLWEGGWCMLAPRLHNRPHRHVAASLLVGLEQPIRVQLAGHWVRAEAVWAAPDVDQALDSDGPVAVIHLDPDHRAWRALGLQGPGGAFLLDYHRAFADRLRALAAAPSVAGALAVRAALEQSGEPVPLDPRILTACRLLRHGDDRDAHGPTRTDWSGLALAEQVELSESRFRHLFRQQLGVNLKRFQLHLKCQRALTLWRDGMSLTDLAQAAGFYDQPHLNRTLRAMFDTLPSRYARAYPIRVEHLDGEPGER